MAVFDPTIWGNVAQWAGALATILAVIVALFKDEIIRHFRHPDLRMSINLRPPDCHKTKIGFPRQSGTVLWVETDRYYLRLCIENYGAIRAEKVQVFASKLWKRNTNGS